VRLGHCETDGIGETLAKRASGDFDTGGVMSLRVTGGDAVNLLWGRSVIDHTGVAIDARVGSTYTEVLEVVDGDLVAEEMDQSILEHASVTVAVRKGLARWLDNSKKNDNHIQTVHRSNAEMRPGLQKSHAYDYVSLQSQEKQASRLLHPAEKGVELCCEFPQSVLRFRPPLALDATFGANRKEIAGNTYDRTKRSRLTQSGFFGLKVMNLLKTT
jgi:hypothetical protein